MQPTHLAAWTVTVLASPLCAQLTWELRSPSPSQPFRYGAAITYDSVRGRTIMFGGGDGSSETAETWQYDGTGWFRIPTAHSPPVRVNALLAYDSARDRVVMFGGYAFPSGPLGDTWEFDGVDWSDRTSTPSPAARYESAMVYDAARASCVVFGGTLRDGSLLYDTWCWNGQVWTEMISSTPSARHSHAMAFDSRRGVVVMFGGFSYPPRRFNSDTWEWDGAQWSLNSPAAPSGRIDHGMCYDARRQPTLMVGGRTEVNSPLFSETWELTGSGWTLVDPVHLSGERIDLVYNVARGRVVALPTRTNQTWEAYSTSPGSIAPFGAGCASTLGTLELSSRSGTPPLLRNTLELDLGPLGSSPLTLQFGLLGVSRSRLGMLPLPVDLGLVGAPGCSLLTSSETASALTNRGGAATWALTIPGSQALLGANVYFQGAAMDPRANAFGFVTSNGLGAVIGW
jgi:hypothetical protein